LEEIALQSSTTERRAADAERELLQLKTLEFMSDKLGDQFEGIVIHISRDGMLVELLDLFIEGFVKISSLDTDNYRFAGRPPVLIGTNSKDIFRLGDRLTVAVDRVDHVQKRVELSVVFKAGRE
jgi:ribonuclease R